MDELWITIFKIPRFLIDGLLFFGVGLYLVGSKESLKTLFPLAAVFALIVIGVRIVVLPGMIPLNYAYGLMFGFFLCVPVLMVLGKKKFLPSMIAVILGSSLLVIVDSFPFFILNKLVGLSFEQIRGLSLYILSIPNLLLLILFLLLHQRMDNDKTSFIDFKFSDLTPETLLLRVIPLGQCLILLILYLASVFTMDSIIFPFFPFVTFSLFVLIIYLSSFIDKKGPNYLKAMFFLFKIFDFAIIFPFIMVLLFYSPAWNQLVFLFVLFIVINSAKPGRVYGLLSLFLSLLGICALWYRDYNQPSGISAEYVILLITVFLFVYYFVQYVILYPIRKSQISRMISLFSDYLFYTDENGRIVSANEAGLRFLQISKQDVYDVPLADYFSEKKILLGKLDRVKKDPSGPVTFNLTCCKPGGGRDRVQVTISAILDELNDLRGFMVSLKRSIEQPDTLLFKERYGLSNREVDILDSIARGYSNQNIGEHLFISIPTVKTHISNIFRKLGVCTRVEVIHLLQQIEDQKN